MIIQQLFERLSFIILSALCMLASTMQVFGQVTQTVRGRVIDQQTKIELIGANVIIDGTLLGDATNLDGDFRIPGVPLGRHTIKVTYLGYKTRYIPEVLVGSAKEVILNIELEEEVIFGNEIVVSPGEEKGKPQNSLSTVSARAFTVEETQRYAGGFDDPARLASSFAGVTYGNAQDNAIIVRGNSPNGLLWRLEGVEVPNPNHFPEGNVMGGGLFTIFSSNLLADSDFFTGAFPAEYGNATSGVFDMKFRNGNNENREYTFQAGMLGIDFSTEGPIKYGSDASYLINYRYSTFGLLVDLGAIDTNEEIRYQDLSFKVNVPTRKAGTFSYWGIGAKDKVVQTAKNDPSEWLEAFDRFTMLGEFRTGATGLNHKLVIGSTTFLNTSLALTTQEIEYDMDRMDDNVVLRNNEFITSRNSKLTLMSTLNHKFSPRFNSTSGFVIDHLMYDMDFKSTINDVPDTYQTFVAQDGNSQLIGVFSQVKYAFLPNVSVNGGLRYQYFALNGNGSVEPRAGLSWDIAPRHSMSFGYGRHSKMEALQYYLGVQETESGSIYPNEKMDFTKTDHFVLSYSFRITPNVQIKIEPYYQNLFDVPVIADSSFSMINLKDERYINDPLVNEGTGKNYGLDVTLERFLSNNYYYMISGSLFESKYTGGDDIERDSRYNRKYVVNVLGGREFQVKKNNILSVNTRLTLMGGERTAPVLEAESIEAQFVLLDQTRAFEKVLTANKFLDITVNYRMNHTNASHVLSLMVKNILGSENDYGYAYRFQTNTIERDKEAIVFPSLSYRIEF